MDPVVIQNIPGTEPTPVPAAPPVQQPVAVPPVPAGPVPATFGDGGSAGGNPVKKFFADVSFTDVGILILASCAMYYVISHYRREIKRKKQEQSEITNKIDELEANLKSAMGPNYKSFD
jgi:hypothetical protein